jgi:hypothetical protein
MTLQALSARPSSRRVLLNSRDEGSECASMTWPAPSARPHLPQLVALLVLSSRRLLCLLCLERHLRSQPRQLGFRLGAGSED